MNINGKQITLAAASAAVLSITAVGAAFAIDDDDATERPIPVTQLDRAKDAALAETGGGRVTGTEIDDEESKYEVEVTLDNGHQVDVQLDENFKVVGTEQDGVDDAEPGDN